MDEAVYERMSNIEGNHWWFVSRRRIVSDILADLCLPENARILEAGCGTGGNLEMLSKLGEVSAFEPDNTAFGYSMEKGYGDIKQGLLPDQIPFDEGAYDLVVALDVLEHVDQDMKSFEALVDRLKTGGKLLITVPAFQALWSAHDESHMHKRRYSRKSLLALTQKLHNIDVKLVSYYNMILFPLALLIRFLKNTFKHKGMVEDELPPEIINTALSKIFSFERFLVGKVWMPFGLSLILIVTKER